MRACVLGAVVQPRVGGAEAGAARVQRAGRGAARGAEARQQADAAASLHRLLRRLRRVALLQEPRQVRALHARAGQFRIRRSPHVHTNNSLLLFLNSQSVLMNN
jgi:hypothetical protein